MAQTSWPFENIDTTETQFSQWARNINEGIRQGSGSELVVGAPGGAMTVTVGTGQAMIRGHYYSSDAVETLTIAAANPSNPRIDSVVLELDPTANTVILKVLTGTPAGSPVAPSLTQTDAGIYQIRLANVAVGTGVLQITSGNITDLRTYMFAGIGKWTTATRPTNPVANQTTGYNTTIGAHEFWNGTSWVGFADPITTRGDLIVGGVGGAPERLAVGTVDQVLTSDGTDVYWADPAGAGGFYYKSTGATVSNTFGTGLFLLTFTGGGNFVFGGISYTQGSHLAEYTTEPGSLTLPSQLGVIWTSANKSPQIAQADFAFGANVFVGASFDFYSSYSTDGVTWSTVSQPSTMRSVAYGNGLFALVGDNGTIRVSTDGVTWSSRTSGITTVLSNIHFLNGNFLIISDSTTLLHSTDTITWTSRTLTGFAYGYSIAYGAGTYLAQGVDGGGNPKVWTSTNLVTWTSRTTGGTTTSSYLATFFNNRFIVFYEGQQARISTDGITWSGQNAVALPGWQAAEIAGNLFISTNGNGTSLLARSTDGLTWTLVSTVSSSSQGRGLIYAQDKVILGTTGFDYFRSSASNVYASIELKTPVITV